MHTLFRFFAAVVNTSQLNASRRALAGRSFNDIIDGLLPRMTTDELLAVRDGAYEFINRINDELVKDGR